MNKAYENKNNSVVSGYNVGNTDTNNENISDFYYERELENSASNIEIFYKRKGFKIRSLVKGINNIGTLSLTLKNQWSNTEDFITKFRNSITKARNQWRGILERADRLFSEVGVDWNSKTKQTYNVNTAATMQRYQGSSVSPPLTCDIPLIMMDINDDLPSEKFVNILDVCFGKVKRGKKGNLNYSAPLGYSNIQLSLDPSKGTNDGHFAVRFGNSYIVENLVLESLEASVSDYYVKLNDANKLSPFFINLKFTFKTNEVYDINQVKRTIGALTSKIR